MNAKEALERTNARPDRLRAAAVSNCRNAILAATTDGVSSVEVDIAETDARNAAGAILTEDGYNVTDTGNGLLIDWSQAQ